VASFIAAAAISTPASAQSTDPQNLTSIQLYGFAMADGIYDTHRVDPNWEDAFRPSKIGVNGEFGSNGQSSISVKQSRIGIQGSLPPVEGNPINFKFEFDFFGVGVDAGQTTIRLRHFYGEWGQILAGQTHSLFMDIDVFPNVIDYWGPPGMVFYRLPQLRWTPFRSDTSHFSIALERPGNDIDAGQIREFDPGLAESLRGTEQLADFTAQYYTSGDWGHFQIAGILRRVGFDTINTPDHEPNGHRTGWGVDISGHAALFEKDKLVGSVVVGQGIATYMNDGGTDLSANGIPARPAQVITPGPQGLFPPQALLLPATPGSASPKAVPLLGIMAYYDHYWSDKWSSSIGYSFTRVDNTNLQDPSAFREGEYASVNLLYTPASSLLIGGEVMWGQRTDHDRSSGDDVRFQISVKYSFSTKFNL
jgi:hypothetical protein